MIQSKMSNYMSPIPLSEIEEVLTWVDKFNLSRPTKKINRDFSDGVLLAEILCVHYPKLVEMHNYPPRNSYALKLNNWMTLNRKVLKKLRLSLCTDTMEQLAKSAPGIIERILIMVRDKIRRDEEANRSAQDLEQNMSSGGSYYEACGDEENVLMVPVKTRVNGVLEMIQQKVVTYRAYQAIKEELKDAKDATDLLKQKVDHLENLMKLKEERIDELQKQLERKATRRKETENLQNSLGVPFNESLPPSPKVSNSSLTHKKSMIKNTSYTKILNVVEDSGVKTKVSEQKEGKEVNEVKELPPNIEVELMQNEVTVIEKVESYEIMPEPEPKNSDEEFKDSLQELVTIEDSIQREINDITNTFPCDTEMIVN